MARWSDAIEAYAFVELVGLKWLLLLMSKHGVVLIGLRDNGTVESRLIGQLCGSYREEWRIADGEIVSVAIIEHAAIPGNHIEFETGPPASGRGFVGAEAACRRRMETSIRKRLRTWAFEGTRERGDLLKEKLE